MHSNNKIDFVHYVHYNNNNEMPTDITVKLPLKLAADDLVAKPRRGRIPTRPPNNFLIFRTAYTRVLQSRGHWDLRMREVTSHAARAWALASPEVKLEKDHLPLSLPDNNLQIEDCSSSTSTTPPTPPIQDVVTSIYFDDMMSHNYSQACEWPEHHHIGYEMSFSSSGSDLGENVHRYTTTIYPSG
ncbi:1566_t:CDS:2 [Entrophospora sp. SA101]|nr:14485_t:CDS:2 [Entrophospora sp. SA101]CAJ0847391.1 1566_t:CDS:2 [Entrophospora sp. SA101]